MAFKVGDRVRLKEDAIYGDTPHIKGREAKIVHVENSPDFLYPYMVDCGGTKQVFKASELELIAPVVDPQPAQTHDYMLAYGEGYRWQLAARELVAPEGDDRRAGFLAGYAARLERLGREMSDRLGITAQH